MNMTEISSPPAGYNAPTGLILLFYYRNIIADAKPLQTVITVRAHYRHQKEKARR
jgi:hypothetical protein